MSKNFSLKGYQFLTLLLIFLLSGYYLGINEIKAEWKKYTPIIEIKSKSPPAATSLDMSLFYNVLDKVNKDYYDKTKVESQKVLYGAVSGMLQSLNDPYTSFFPPAENSSFKTQMAGEFFGIGAELGMSSEKRIMVISPLDGSPAKKAGIKNGDLILKVDGEDTAGWEVSNAVSKIRGPKGSTVKLSVLHENEKKQVELSIIRDIITIKSVIGKMEKVEYKDGIYKIAKNCPTCASVMYMRISQFGDKTNDEWIAAVNSLVNQAKNEKNFKGIVLDLRNNPGGYLRDAVFIASEFLKSGVVVMQEDNTGEIEKLNISRKGLMTDYPLMVVVNKGSASASEILSGALKDYNRAKLVGETTFGKGTIQEAIEVGGGASVHLSVGKWLTPNGTWVHGTGIEPDIKVEYKAPKEGENPDFDNQIYAAIQELLK